MAFPVYSQVWPLGPAGPRARPVGFSRSPHLSTEGSRVCLGGPTQTPSPLGPPSAGVPAPPPPVVSKLDVLSRDFYFSRSVVSGGDSVFDSQWQAQVIYQEHTHTLPVPRAQGGLQGLAAEQSGWVFNCRRRPLLFQQLKFPERRQSGPGHQVRGVSPGSLSLSFLN